MGEYGSEQKKETEFTVGGGGNRKSDQNDGGEQEQKKDSEEKGEIRREAKLDVMEMEQDKEQEK